MKVKKKNENDLDFRVIASNMIVLGNVVAILQLFSYRMLLEIREMMTKTVQQLLFLLSKRYEHPSIVFNT